MLTLQIIGIMDTIWQSEDLDLRYVPYVMETRRCRGLLYDIRLGNGAGIFLQSCSPHGPVSDELLKNLGKIPCFPHPENVCTTNRF